MVFYFQIIVEDPTVKLGAFFRKHYSFRLFNRSDPLLGCTFWHSLFYSGWWVIQPLQPVVSGANLVDTLVAWT